jgi:chromate transport protein ChrA
MIVTYLKLFYTFAKIGMFTIGGGYAMIPLIEREIVKKKWMSKEEFMEMFALTQSLPGVFAVNISIFVGYKLHHGCIANRKRNKRRRDDYLRKISAKSMVSKVRAVT